MLPYRSNDLVWILKNISCTYHVFPSDCNFCWRRFLSRRTLNLFLFFKTPVTARECASVDIVSLDALRAPDKTKALSTAPAQNRLVPARFETTRGFIYVKISVRNKLVPDPCSTTRQIENALVTTRSFVLALNPAKSRNWGHFKQLHADGGAGWGISWWTPGTLCCSFGCSIQQSASSPLSLLQASLGFERTASVRWTRILCLRKKSITSSVPWWLPHLRHFLTPYKLEYLHCVHSDDATYWRGNVHTGISEMHITRECQIWKHIPHVSGSARGDSKFWFCLASSSFNSQTTSLHRWLFPNCCFVAFGMRGDAASLETFGACFIDYACGIVVHALSATLAPNAIQFPTLVLVTKIQNHRKRICQMAAKSRLRRTNKSLRRWTHILRVATCNASPCFNFE